jgi:neutral ceramidase
MKAGFGKIDITPRLGVELFGYGVYRQRRAERICERLYARAMAVEDGGERWALVSADLGEMPERVTAEARRLASERTGLAPERMLFHAIHTHSAPAVTYEFTGWGEPDAPYMERLPHLLAEACRQSVENMEEAQFARAEAPAEGIAFNRELYKAPPYDEAMKDDWRPEDPERTDTTAHVIRVNAGGRLKGFMAYFSCHAALCGESTNSIHGDYCGAAVNAVEAENPGATGLFLQGASGDINTCVGHQPEDKSLKALKVIGERFARSIRRGLAEAKPFAAAPIGARLARTAFARRRMDLAEMKAQLAKQVETIRTDPQGEASGKVRMATVMAHGYRAIIEAMEKGKPMEKAVDMQALRLGEAVVIGTPFEVFHGTKERLKRETGVDALLMLGHANGVAGYAVTREASQRAGPGHYARDMIPIVLGGPPYTEDLEDEIVKASKELMKSVGMPPG